MAPPDLTATAQRVTGDHADRIEALQAIVVGCCVAPRHPGGPAQPVPPQPPAEPDAGGGESDDGEGQAPTVEPSPAPPVLPPAPFPEGPVERWPE